MDKFNFGFNHNTSYGDGNTLLAEDLSALQKVDFSSGSSVGNTSGSGLNFPGMSMSASKALSAGGTILDAYGTKLEADAGVAALQKQAAFHAAEEVQARLVGQREEEALRRQGDSVVSSQKLTMIANGLDLSGSSMSIVDDTLVEIEKQANDINQMTSFNASVARAKRTQALEGIKQTRMAEGWSHLASIAKIGATAIGA